MEENDAKIKRVWNRTEVIVFECLIQLLSSLQVTFSHDNIRLYFNKVVRRISQLGYDIEIYEKSVKESQSRSLQVQNGTPKGIEL